METMPGSRSTLTKYTICPCKHKHGDCEQKEKRRQSGAMLDFDTQKLCTHVGSLGSRFRNMRATERVLEVNDTASGSDGIDLADNGLTYRVASWWPLKQSFGR